jgi:hypothetical protein
MDIVTSNECKASTIALFIIKRVKKKSTRYNTVTNKTENIKSQRITLVSWLEFSKARHFTFTFDIKLFVGSMFGLFINIFFFNAAAFEAQKFAFPPRFTPSLF